jgi:hypothetical protein
MNNSCRTAGAQSRGEHRFSAFENKVRRNIFENAREEGMKDKRK